MANGTWGFGHAQHNASFDDFLALKSNIPKKLFQAQCLEAYNPSALVVVVQIDISLDPRLWVGKEVEEQILWEPARVTVMLMTMFIDTRSRNNILKTANGDDCRKKATGDQCRKLHSCP